MSGQCKPRSWDRGPSLSPSLSILPRSLLSRGEMGVDTGHAGPQLVLLIRWKEKHKVLWTCGKGVWFVWRSSSAFPGEVPLPWVGLWKRKCQLRTWKMGDSDSRPGKEDDSPGEGWSRSGPKTQNPFDKFIYEGSCSWGGEWRIKRFDLVKEMDFKDD